MKYPAIASRFDGSVWAILPGKLDEIKAFVASKINGRPVMAFMDSDGEEEAPLAYKAGSVGVINIVGTIMQRVSSLERSSGGVSSEEIGVAFDSLMADASVSAIVLNIDSPGGSVYGMHDLADKIYEARESKKIVAFANPLAASAAYLIGSAASEFYATRDGEVGSVGVFGVHIDMSEADKMEGFKYTYISAGKYKTEGNPHEPLSDEAKDHAQEAVDWHYSQLLKAIGRHRGISAGKVASDFGEGRTVMADKAKAAGMIDGTRKNLGEVVSRLQPRGRATGTAKARMALMEKLYLAS